MKDQIEEAIDQLLEEGYWRKSALAYMKRSPSQASKRAEELSKIAEMEGTVGAHKDAAEAHSEASSKWGDQGNTQKERYHYQKYRKHVSIYTSSPLEKAKSSEEDRLISLVGREARARGES